jgi:hypothetical protein
MKKSRLLHNDVTAGKTSLENELQDKLKLIRKHANEKYGNNRGEHQHSQSGEVTYSSPLVCDEKSAIRVITVHTCNYQIKGIKIYQQVAKFGLGRFERTLSGEESRAKKERRAAPLM